MKTLAFLLALAATLLFPARAVEFATAPYQQDAAARELIEKALPAKAPAKPLKPRRLLVFTLNVGYGGHPSANDANHAFALMGERTGAFQMDVSKDPAVFAPDSLRRYDAVFFNNNVGNLFEDPALRQSLMKFVYSGGGLLGVHGTAVAFTKWPGAIEDWPEFGVLLAGRGANHRDSDERAIIRVEDPANPITRAFGGPSFEYRDEYFRVHEPYSRQRARVLLSIDNEKTGQPQGPPRGDCLRADNDYALAWVRQYGRGRAFYCTIAHNPYVFRDPKMLEFYLAAIQFALGDLPCPTLPSAFLTPAASARERLGWRVGLQANATTQSTLFESIDQAASRGLRFLGATSAQKVGPELPVLFDATLNEEQLRQIRLKLDAASLRLLTYEVPSWPTDEAKAQRLARFARQMGVEVLIADAPADSWDTLEQLARTNDLRIALRAHNPKQLARQLRSRSAHLGAYGDTGEWLRASMDPFKAVKALGEHLCVLQLADTDRKGAQARPVPWGKGEGATENILREMVRLSRKPVVFGLDASVPPASAATSLDFFDDLCLTLGK